MKEKSLYFLEIYPTFQINMDWKYADMASTGLLNFNVSKLKLAVYDILGVVRHFSPAALSRIYYPSWLLIKKMCIPSARTETQSPRRFSGVKFFALTLV